MKGVGVDFERPGFHFVVGQETEAGDAAIGRDVLVLLADRLAQQVDLDVAGLPRQLLAVDERAVMGVQRPQQRGGEAAGRAQAGAGGNVRHAGDFQVRRAQAGQLERLPHDGVLHLGDGVHVLELRVLDDQLLREGVVQGDVDVLVDGGGDQEAAVLR